MGDYAKKKNDELVTLCKERGLPHTGKKNDMVKRLEEHDAKQVASSAPAAVSTTVPAPAATAEDEIDWDDDTTAAAATGASSEPAAAAVAAGGIGQVKNPVAVPNQVQVEDPATTDDLTVLPPAANGDAAPPAEEAKEPGKDFTSGIAERTIDEEIEKRKVRARKFGLPEDSDEIKMLERAKKFGVTDTSSVPGMLNQALGNDRKRARGGLDGPLADGGARKRGRGGRENRRGTDRREAAGRGSASAATEKKAAGGGGFPAWMTEADRAKAETRKGKFEAPA